MTTHLVNINELDFNQIAALTGANIKTETVILPSLTVNREPEDDQGNTQPMGHFVLSQGEEKLFSPKITFRVLINAYQYSEYSPAEKKFVNRSIIIKSFNEEPLDEKGGLSCGKVKYNDIPQCSAEEQLRQKNIKCRRLVYGLVSFPGNKDIHEVPCLMKLTGSNFMSPKNDKDKEVHYINEALDVITKMKHHFFQHNMELSTKRQKEGTTIFYLIDFKPNLKEEVKLTEANMEAFKQFQEAIDKENNYILKAWRQAKQQAVKEITPNYLKELELNDSVDDL